jgi:RHS repeat-associated protein
VTGRPGFTHTYDAVNRLIESQPAGGNLERYEYDGHGRRTAMVRSNGTVKIDYYTRDGVLRATADQGMGTTGGSAIYVHLGDLLVAQDASAWRSPFGMTYFHVDHQGTPIARSDAWGGVFERTRRESFGLPLTGPLKNGPGYTGHMEDPGTGLVYMQQRYYDPAIARFLSVDPVGPLADPTNHFGRYHYGLNNPYRFTDPDGRIPIDTVIDVGFLIYDTGRFLGAAAAAGVGAATGNEALTREGLAGMRATGADLATSAVSAVTPYASAPMARLGKEAVGDATRTGRGANNLRPDPNAQGAHSTFKRDSSGAITNTATYEPNPRNPSGFQEVKRVDVSGKAHTNPDGTVVPAPHVKEAGKRKVRPARPDELPR